MDGLFKSAQGSKNISCVSPTTKVTVNEARPALAITVAPFGDVAAWVALKL